MSNATKGIGRSYPQITNSHDVTTQLDLSFINDYSHYRKPLDSIMKLDRPMTFLLNKKAKLTDAISCVFTNSNGTYVLSDRALLIFNDFFKGQVDYVAVNIDHQGIIHDNYALVRLWPVNMLKNLDFGYSEFAQYTSFHSFIKMFTVNSFDDLKAYKNNNFQYFIYPTRYKFIEETNQHDLISWEHLNWSPWVSERFRIACEQAKITGLNFDPFVSVKYDFK